MKVRSSDDLEGKKNELPLKKSASLPQVIGPTPHLFTTITHPSYKNIYPPPHSKTSVHSNTQGFFKFGGNNFNFSNLLAATSRAAAKIEDEVFKVANSELVSEKEGPQPSAHIFEVRGVFLLPWSAVIAITPDSSGWFALSLVFLTNGIPFPSNIEIHILTRDDYFTETTIQRFGFVQW